MYRILCGLQSRSGTKVEEKNYLSLLGMGQALTQLVKALRYKPQGRGFDSRWCHRKFSLTWSFRPHYGPGAESASNRNEYQEYILWGKGGRCVGLIILPLSCADCLAIWEPQPPGTLRNFPGFVLPFSALNGNCVFLQTRWYKTTKWHSPASLHLLDYSNTSSEARNRSLIFDPSTSSPSLFWLN